MQVTAQEDGETVSDILGIDISTNHVYRILLPYSHLEEILQHSFSRCLLRSHEERRSDGPILQKRAKVRASFHSFVLE